MRASLEPKPTAVRPRAPARRARGGSCRRPHRGRRGAPGSAPPAAWPGSRRVRAAGSAPPGRHQPGRPGGRRPYGGARWSRSPTCRARRARPR